MSTRLLIPILFILLIIPVASAETGEQIYSNTCEACHGANGSGALPGQPDFNSYTFWITTTQQELFDAVYNGQGAMPAQSGTYSDSEVISALRYEAQTFGGVSWDAIPSNTGELYDANCASCHGPDGTGLIPGQPDFTSADFWNAESQEELTNAVTNGVQGTAMPAFQGQLSEDEIRAVLEHESDFAGVSLASLPDTIGEKIYSDNCEACHGANGSDSLPGQPDFTDPTFWEGENQEELFDAVYNGQGAMPAQSGTYTEDEVIAALTYEAQTFGGINWNNIPKYETTPTATPSSSLDMWVTIHDSGIKSTVTIIGSSNSYSGDGYIRIIKNGEVLFKKNVRVENDRMFDMYADYDEFYIGEGYYFLDAWFEGEQIEKKIYLDSIISTPTPKATPTTTPTITTGVDVTSIIGTIDSTASGIKTIAINVKLRPGSDDIDLSKATIQYIDSDTLQDLTYGSSASGSNFAISKVKDVGVSSAYILNDGRDVYTITINANEVRGGSNPLPNSNSATIRLTPATGAQTTREIQVPAILGSPGGRVDMGSSGPIVTATPTPRATPTVTATPIPELQDLSISVEPEEVEAAGGDVVNYTVRLNWFPKTWTGPVKVDLDVTGLGVSKQYTYDFFITEDMEPPIEAPINFQIPESAPPSTYEAEIVAKAPVKGGQPGEVTPMDWREDVLIAVAKVAIKVILSQSPGFLGITGLIGLFGAAVFIRRKRV